MNKNLGFFWGKEKASALSCGVIKKWSISAEQPEKGLSQGKGSSLQGKIWILHPQAVSCVDGRTEGELQPLTAEGKPVQEEGNCPSLWWFENNPN